MNPYIPPRLHSLLKVLAFTETPISVNELAKQLRVSRRTIFREIEGIDTFLRPYNLSLNTKVGKGIYIWGDQAGIKGLRETLEEKNAGIQSNRDERRAILALELLTGTEPQKLYYYASFLKVSEATISYDLDFLEVTFAKFGVSILRKPGHGVSAVGNEVEIRRVICHTIMESKRMGTQFYINLSYPTKEKYTGIDQLMETRFKHRLVWMTSESKDVLAVYMAVAVERISSHNEIEMLDEEVPSSFLPIADFFANSLELQFSIVFSEQERKNLAVYLSALRQSAHFSEKPEGAERDYFLKSLAYRMIEHFDPELAPFLKLDDRLVEGLALHLQSAIVRIKNHVELIDPLFEELSRTYPEILAKSKRALEVLGKFSSDISEYEASFLATHFGAGVFRIKEHGKRHRLKIGVVCAGGIGTSYFMASQIKKVFASQVEIEICGLGDVADWNDFDLCITSIPLQEIPIPMVQVNQLLEQKDFDAIRLYIGKISQQKVQDIQPEKASSLLESCENAYDILLDVRSILANFTVVSIEGECDFDHLVKLAGYRFGSCEEKGRLIYEDLIKRESLSTQVIPSLQLVLLHVQTMGIDGPVFSIIKPEGENFTAPVLAGLRSCIIMLVPKAASRNTLNLMGRISSALLENSYFLESVLKGDKEKTYQKLEEILRNYLTENIIF